MDLVSLPGIRYRDTPDAFKASRPEFKGLGVEFKSIAAAEIKADRTKRRVELWIAGHGNVDKGGDLILQGAAAQTIAEDFPRDLVKLFWNHREPLGVVEVLEEHKEGLFMVGKVTDHPEFDKRLAQIEDKTAAHGSLGLTVREFEQMTAAEVKREFRIDPGGHGMVRVIKNYRVWEGSPVIWPMNEMVKVVRVKKGIESMEKKGLWELADVIAALARIRSLTSAEWAELTDDEAEAATALLNEMRTTEKLLCDGIAHRELKSGKPPAIESAPTSAESVDFKALIEAAESRAKAIEICH